MSTLDEIETRARRHLDGMTVNRDAMANDVLRLCKALREARAKANQGKFEQRTNGSVAETFDGIFEGIFGTRRGTE